jgi:hypothetical protein
VSGLGFLTFGTIYYVDADNGSDDNDGLAMDKAFATLAEAYAATTSNNHDVIVLSANGGHTLTDELLIAKNRVHIVGTGFRGGAPMGQRSRITVGATTGDAIAAIQITGVGVTLNNLKISSADTLSTSVYGVADGGEFTVMRNCWVEKSTDLDQTGAAELLCNSDTGAYIDCTFGNMIYQPSVARQNVLFTRETISGKVARDVYFGHCTFQSFATSTTFVNCRATTNDIERMAWFERCLFQSKAGSSTQDEAFGIASALTDAHVALHDCMTVNITNLATAASGVYSNQANSQTLGGKGIEVT